MFGFLKGKATLSLDRYQFTPGETIEGDLVFRLKKPIEAEGVAIELYGMQVVTQFSGGKRSRRTTKVFDFEQPLDGEKTYSANQDLSYRFSLRIPEDVLTQPNIPDSGFGAVVKTAQMLSGTNSRINWYVRGSLKVRGFDVSKKAQITIG